MNYLMVDISGKVLNYDIALCNAMFEVLHSDIHLFLFAANLNPKCCKFSCKRLISLIPESMQNSGNLLKRGIKAIEGLVNYMYIVLYVLFHKIDVLHFQWLPFLEISSVEKIFLRLLKIVSPKTKFFLTVHNLYPHNSSAEKKEKYRVRFSKIQSYFDKFILHLEVSKKSFCREFSIDESKAYVISHGIFVPENMTTVESNVYSEKLNLIMYGNQSYYKGTDILVDALNLLPKNYSNRIHTEIVGKISSNYYDELKKKTQFIDVEWIPEFIPNEVLYDKIKKSNIIIIPYREISQSGVLLLALSFNRAIIISDLPSFKETLRDYPKSMFFRSNDAQGLSDVIKDVLDKKNDLSESLKSLDHLKNLYQWTTIAKKYKELL